MNRREARRAAYGIAYRFVQQALNVGPGEGVSEADAKKIEDELDTITQRLFEKSNLQTFLMTPRNGKRKPAHG